MKPITLLLLLIAIARLAGLPRAATAQSPGLSGNANSLEDLRTRKTGRDWPGFLGPNGDSKSAETGVISPGLQQGWPVLWHKEIGEGYGAPSTSLGRLFVFDRVGREARLLCLNSETGDPLWQFTYETDYEDLYRFSNGPRTVPVVDRERVYIFGVEGMLFCLSSTEGKIIWQRDTATDFNVVQNFFGVGSTPVVEGDLLIVAVGGSPPNKHPNVLAAQGRVEGNAGLVAFDKYTGRVVYKTSDELASYATPLITTIDGRRLGLWFARGGLLGFEPQSGKIDFLFPWRSRKLESVNASNPVVAADRVFISESYGPGSAVLKIGPDAYKVLWQDQPRSRDKAMQLHWNTAIHHDGYLYGCTGGPKAGSALRCISLETGAVQWSHTVNERSSLVYADQHFISLGEDGTVILFKASPEEIKIITEAKIRDPEGRQLIVYPAWAAPVISHGYLYLRGRGRLACIDLL